MVLSSRMSASTRFLITRALLAPIALLIVVTLSFGLVALLPGDPARAIAGPEATDSQVSAIRHELDLDLPVAERYIDYLAGLFSGDLGNSFRSGQPISSEILKRLPATLELITAGLLCALLIGLGLGILSALYQNRTIDRVVNVVISGVQSIPEFFFALILIFIGFYTLGLAPAPSGRLGFSDSVPPRRTGFLLIDSMVAGEWVTLGSVVAHLALPALTLGLYYSVFIARTSRAAVGEALNSEQVHFALACGLSRRRVLHYAFLEARTPILTYGGILLGGLVGGAVIVELIFAWGGLGEWALNAILALDVPAIQGFVLVSGSLVLLVFLSLDILVMLLDPRIRYV